MKTYTKDKSTKLSANFKSTEFDCKGVGCCSKTNIDPKLVEYVQKIRTHFGKSVTINSGYRCAKHNKAVGGATNSQHAKGKAADIVVTGIRPATVAKYAESIGVKGIGLYENADGNFVHIDTRAIKSFWYGHKQAKRTTFGGAVQKYSGTFPTLSAKGYLSKGDVGTQVVYLQKFLNWYGGYKLTTDGKFGVETETAVKKFQTAVKITADGKFGSKSLSKAKSIKK